MGFYCVCITQFPCCYRGIWASLRAQEVKNLPAMQETWVRSLVQEDPWRRKWLPTPVFLPGKSQGQGILVGYSLWGCKESDRTEWITHTHTHTGVFGLFSDILLLQTLWLLWTVFKRDSTNLAFYQWVQALDIAHGTFWFVNFASLVGTKGISHRSSCKVPRSLKEVEHFIYLLANRFFLPWHAG